MQIAAVTCSASPQAIQNMQCPHLKGQRYRHSKHPAQCPNSPLRREQWEARIAELRRLIGFILSKEGGKEIYALIRRTEAVIGRALCAHSIAKERSDAMRTTTFQLGR